MSPASAYHELEWPKNHVTPSLTMCKVHWAESEITALAISDGHSQSTQLNTRMDRAWRKHNFLTLMWPPWLQLLLLSFSEWWEKVTGLDIGNPKFVDKIALLSGISTRHHSKRLYVVFLPWGDDSAAARNRTDLKSLCLMRCGIEIQYPNGRITTFPWWFWEYNLPGPGSLACILWFRSLYQCALRP